MVSSFRHISYLTYTLPIDISLWYRHFAYHNYANMKKMINQGLVTSLNLDSDKKPNPICKPCIAVKILANHLFSLTNYCCFLLAVTKFIQLVSLQLVDWFSQTKLCWKAQNESYLYICRMYKSNNKQLRYQAISSYKSFIC